MTSVSKEVKTYDFHRPEKVSKDQLRNLQILHENFARVVTVELSAMLRTVLTVRLESVSQELFNEAIEDWMSPGCIGVLEIPPLEGTMIVYISPELVFGLIDRLLGGSGKAVTLNREFTELEIVLIRKLFKVIELGVKETWHSLISLSPKLEEVEVNPQFVQIFSPNEPVLRCVYTGTLQDISGQIVLVMSFISLEELLPKLSAQHMLRLGVGGAGKLGEDRVKDVNVIFRVCFPSFLLGLKTIEEFLPGVIINTGLPVQDKVDVWVSDKVIFKGKVGRLGRKLAVRLLDVCKSI